MSNKDGSYKRVGWLILEEKEEEGRRKKRRSWCCVELLVECLQREGMEVLLCDSCHHLWC